MAVATSYLQPNNYQAANTYRPYSLPVNDAFKAVTAQSEFWEREASQIKSAYDNALGLKLSIKANQELRDQFMKDVEKQITKLSSANLSDPSVQKEAMSLFKPIYQDEGIMYDDLATRHFEKVRADALSYREKNNGAQYSDDNFAYAMQDYGSFVNSQDRLAGKAVYQNRKEYTPYYDIAKERQDILKNCKPDKVAGTMADGPYLSSQSISSLSSQKLWGCLEAGLSEQARNQIRISGSVRYQNNLEGLREDYILGAQEKQKFYSDHKKEITAKRAAALKSNDKNKVLEYDTLLSQVDDQISTLNGQIKTYNSWDQKYLQDNYESLASTAYFKRVNQSFANAYAFQNVESDLKANPIYITHYNQNEALRRQQIGFQQDIYMENLKTQNKLLLGLDDNGKATDQLNSLIKWTQSGGDPSKFSTYITNAEESEGTSINTLRGEINKLDNQIVSITKDLTQEIRRNPDLSSLVDGLQPNEHLQSEEDFSKFWKNINEYSDAVLKTNPNDVTALRIRQAYNQSLRLMNEKTAIKNVVDDANKVVSESNPDIHTNYKKAIEDVKKLITKPLDTGRGEPIPVERLKNIVDGIDPVLELIPGKKTDRAPILRVKPTGETFNIDFLGYKNGWLEMYNKAGNQSKTNYNELVDNYLNDHVAVQRYKLNIGNIFTKGSVANRTVERLFGQNLGGVIGDDITISSINGIDPVTGKVQIQAFHKKEGQISSQALLDAARSSDSGNSNVPRKVDGNTLEIVIPEVVGLMAEPSYSYSTKLNLSYLEKQIREGQVGVEGRTMMIGKDPKGLSYGVKVSKSIGSNNPEYTIIISSNNQKTEIPVSNTVSDPKSEVISIIDKGLQGLLTLKESKLTTRE